MSVLPVPNDLSPPPGGPHDVRDLASDVTAAAVRLGDLAAHLSGRAHVAGWRGADSDATAERVTVMTELAHVSAEALRGAGSRLAMHSDVLHVAHRRIESLRAAQDDDFAAMQTRVSAPVGGIGDDGLGTTPYLEDLEAAEELRRREHAALLSMVADSAAATAVALDAAVTVIGGGGPRHADFEQVAATLAAALPDWGAVTLAAHGGALAERLLGDDDPRPGQEITLQETEALASAALVQASHPNFAGGFVRELGVDGVRTLLMLVDNESFGADSALSALLATTFGAAPSASANGQVERILTARYVDPADQSSTADLLARGMAIVATSTRVQGTGVRSETLLGWARQVVEREQVMGPIADRLRTLSEDDRHADPLLLLTEAIADMREAGLATGLLADRATWGLALSRPWADGGSALADVVALVEDAGSVDGERSVRAAFEALGDSLDEPEFEGRTVVPETASLTAPALGRAAVAHLDVTLDLLAAAAEDRTGDMEAQALRGLGHLTVDEAAAAAIAAALHARQLVRPGRVDATSESVVFDAATAGGALLAVREYGQRLAYALASYERRAEARLRSGPLQLATAPIALIPDPLTKAAAGGLGVAVGRVFDMDGNWENGPDTGLRFDGDDAARHARNLPTLPAAVAEQARTAAVAAFSETARLLPAPKPPKEPDESWLEALVDELGDLGLRDRPRLTTPGGVKLSDLPTPGRGTIPDAPEPPD